MTRILVLAAVLALVAYGRSASAIPAEPDDAGCSAENLVRSATHPNDPIPQEQWVRLADGVVAREGAPWPSPEVAVVLPGRLAFELGRTVVLRRLYLQTDADQMIRFEVSPDGATWTRLDIPPDPVLSGMISRSIGLPGLPARFVRLTSPVASEPITISELSLSCRRQANPRRALRVADDRAGESSGWWSRWKRAHAPSPTEDDAVKLVIVLAAALWMAFEVARRREGPTVARHETPRRRLALVVLGLAALAAYTNFWAYRYPDFLHEHDVFHYFIGAKYFPELGYDGLYECAAVAEADAGFRQRVELRNQRDLRTNRLVSGASVLARAPDCRRRFTPERFREFARDVRYFADSRTVPDWHRILRDHGFNASPTWIAFGAAAARPLPAAAWSIGHGDSMFSGLIGPLDPVLLLVSFGAIVWAFGLEWAAIVAIVFGCNPLSEYSWVGGGFLRELWLATLVSGLCCLRKERFVLGGALLGLSCLLQLFPGACLLGVAVAFALRRLSRKAFDRDGLRVLASAAVTVALLLPVSAVVAGRSDAWSAFAANTRKHAETPSGNLVGLPTALSFRMSTRASVLFDEDAVDPFARVRKARKDNLRPLLPVYVLGVALGFFGLGRALRKAGEDREGARKEWWLCAALGLALVPLLIETSGYYTAWLAAFALVAHGRRALIFPVLAVLCVALVLSITVSELDVSSAFASIALVAGTAAVLWLAARTDPADGPSGPGSVSRLT